MRYSQSSEKNIFRTLCALLKWDQKKNISISNHGDEYNNENAKQKRKLLKITANIVYHLL